MTDRNMQVAVIILQAQKAFSFPPPHPLIVPAVLLVTAWEFNQPGIHFHINTSEQHRQDSECSLIIGVILYFYNEP